MHQATALLGLTTETSLHAGTGAGGEIIDLPIQRESHTGWPCVFGSGVKGALRSLACERFGAGEDKVLAAFGPTTANASEHAGALSVGDARLLLLPVRSITSTFRWVTCPGALRRFQGDARRLGISLRAADIPQVEEESDAFVPSGPYGHLMLEEYRLNTKVKDLGDWVLDLAGLLAQEEGEGLLRERLAVIHDDMFSHLARYAVPVNARVALGPNKTAVDGALWFEESLPPDTLLYAPLLAASSRRPGFTLDAGQVRAFITGELFSGRPWLQLGGHETVGMGWCGVKVMEA